MANKATRRPSNGRLEEALAALINNQALFVGQLARMDERFARIESELGHIKNILLHHEQMLEALPQAIRQQIAFVKPR
ncbi:MAG: hypothetical protein AAB225_10155 [Acidobacteriota bacterium]